MLWEEMGIQAPEKMSTPAHSAAVVFFSFIGFGMIPLLGVAFPLLLGQCLGDDWYRPEYSSIVALIISAWTLFLMGCAIAICTSGEAVMRSGSLILLNGCIASGISFSLSQGVSALTHGESSNGDTKVPEAKPIAPEPVDVSVAISYPWPFFRRRFLRGVCLLWLSVSGFLVAHQLLHRMVFETMRVFAYGLLTCITTGFGVLPLLVVRPESINEAWLARANTISAGMMLAASTGMLWEAHAVSGPWDWQVLAGLAGGVLFIMASQSVLGNDDESGMEGLCGALMERKHFKRAVLIFTVMFCHSAAEGVAVGVAFDRHCEAHFGFYVSMLLAIQNVPEGLTVALVLVPRGVGILLSTFIATLTSVPQPLMAVAAFRFVETFECLLPIGLAFAAGAMIYVSVADLLVEVIPVLGRRSVLGLTGVSFLAMALIQRTLESAAGR